MATPQDVDFGRSAADYARHRQGFPDGFFERLRASGIGGEGQRALDVGTGTGQMARGLALGGASVTGLDRSAELIAGARELDRSAEVEIDYVQAPVESTGLPDASFDVVTAAQCWHWFDHERACAEIARLLIPEGRLVIAQLDWLPHPGSVVEATEALILKHNPGWPLGGLDGLPTHYVQHVEHARFRGVETFSYVVDLAYTHEAWRGRIRASAGIAAGPLDAAAVRRFDDEHAELLAARFPADPMAVPHRVFAILARRPR